MWGAAGWQRPREQNTEVFLYEGVVKLPLITHFMSLYVYFFKVLVGGVWAVGDIPVRWKPAACMEQPSLFLFISVLQKGTKKGLLVCADRRGTIRANPRGVREVSFCSRCV